MNAESSFYLVTCLMLIGFLTQADAVTRLKRHETKPTLSFMPKPRIRSLIWVKTDHQSIKYWKDILKEYLAVYKHPSNNSVSCNLFERPPPGKVCNVDVSSMSNPCTESYGFGYKQATPCVFLELSKEKFVWVSCEGKSPADKENIGPIIYMSQKGFASSYFPYLNQEGYASPIVAVHFERPQRGVVILVECKAWAKNINNDVDQSTSVLFELLVE